MNSSNNIPNDHGELGNFKVSSSNLTANDVGNSLNKQLDELSNWGQVLALLGGITKDIIRIYPEFGTKLEEDKSNLLHLYSEYGYVKIVKVLTSRSTTNEGMSPCIRLDKNEKNPLDYAAMNGKTEVIRLLLEALSHSATTSDVIIATVKKALYLALRGNQGNAFRALAIKFMENWDNVEIIQEKNKLLMGTPRSSDDIPTEDFEALNKKLMSAIRQDQEGIVRLNEFLASNPLLFRTLSSRSCPLLTQFYICVFARQTDDLIDEINKMRHEFEPDEGLDNIDKYPIHRFSSVGCNDIVKLILVYESVENTPLGKSSVCLLKDMDGNTPLHCAAREGKVSVINTLLENCWKCAGVVSDKKNETVLHCALRNNKAKAFKTLLGWYIIKEEFLNNKARDWDCGDTTLDLLVDGYEKIVKELLGQRDSKVCFQRDQYWERSYFVVIKCKNKRSNGTSFEYQDYIREVTSKITNRKILSLSVNSKSIITLKVLIRSSKLRDILDYVKDVDEKTVLDLLDKTKRTTNVMGFVPYERYENVIWLLDAIQMGDYEAFSKLQTEDPQILDYVCQLPLGGTPLHIAVRFGKLNDCTREIIRKRPDFAATKDHKNRNPLHIASAKGYPDIVKELLTQFGFNHCFAMEGEFRGTPVEYAIEKGRISVFNELLSVGWNCVGVGSREQESVLLRTAVSSKQLAAIKMLMERYIEDELLKAKEMDGNPMSALADGYIQIALKHLLSPKANYSLSILVKNRDDGKTTGSKPLLNLYFAVIKVTIDSRKETNNIVDELQLSAYYPKYFREVTVQNEMVLHLLMDNGNSVTFKFLLRSPLFYTLCGNVANSLPDDRINKVAENETESLIPIWINKISDTCRSSSKNLHDDAKEQLGEGTKYGHDGVATDSNEKQLSEAAKEDYENVLENAKADSRNDGAEDDDVESHDHQEMPTDINIPDRLDGNTMRNQERTTNFQIKQEFASYEECGNAIRDAAILGNAEVNFKYLGMQKIFADCSNTSMCNWKIRAYSKGSNFVVTEIENEHKCQRLNGTINKLATPKWVSSQIIEKVRQDPKISPRDIIEFIKSKYHVGISYRTALEAKNKWALKKINGIESKENTIHGSQTESRKRKKPSTDLLSLLRNAHPHRSNLRSLELEYIPTPMH